MLKDTNRSPLFDNLKSLLIFLVVFGHTIEPYIKDNTILMIIYNFIYIFHMPLFVFISGYFSKNIEKSRKSAAANLLVPFVVFNVLAYAFTSIINGKITFGLFSIFIPSWTLWYLISLFIWRISLQRLIKIRYILPISVILGLLIGVVPQYTSYLSIGRTISFLPFFLAGYYADKNLIDKVRKGSKVISYLIIIVSLMAAIFISNSGANSYKFSYLSNPYITFGLDPIMGMMLRMALYILSALMSLSIINLTTDRKLMFTDIGKKTMVIYIGHSFILLVLRKLLPQFNYLVLVIPFLIIFLLDRPISNSIYEKFMDFIKYKILFMKQQDKIQQSTVGS